METKVERAYWGNGELRSETSYVNGVPHGMEKLWHQDGQLRLEVPYVGGKWHGMAKWRRRNGDIEEFRLYNQGEQVAKFNPRNQTQKWKLK
jgi:antitoxin component YwqK of YwqJK toxin-antitoxin module